MLRRNSADHTVSANLTWYFIVRDAHMVYVIACNESFALSKLLGRQS